MEPTTNVLAELIGALGAGKARVVDLTHSLDEESPYWPGDRAESSFAAKVVATYETDKAFAREVTMSEHLGTHMDAPAHFVAGGALIDHLPVNSLIAPAGVIDVRGPAAADPDYRVTAADLERFIQAHGRPPRGAVVFFNTGWAARWPSQTQFANMDARGVKHFPGISLEAAHFLLEQMHPAGVGIDTLSVDHGRGESFPTHHLLLGSGLYILENVANLDLMPPMGAVVIALPLKLTGGSGSPARVVGLVPHQS